MMKSEFKRTNRGVTISFKEMTQGEALALCHALDSHATKSAVCVDVEVALNHAIQRDGKTDADQELFEALVIG
jgi:hypothetical protein